MIKQTVKAGDVIVMNLLNLLSDAIDYGMSSHFVLEFLDSFVTVLCDYKIMDLDVPNWSANFDSLDRADRDDDVVGILNGYPVYKDSPVHHALDKLINRKIERFTNAED